MQKKILTLVIVVLTIQTIASQTIDTLRLNKYFKSLELNNKFMGSVALLKGDTIIYSKQIGFSDIETAKKPNEYTKYRIGSISKTFTATLILKAFEEGKIDLNQTIDNFFSNIKNNHKITISNLLNHRSGIPSFTYDKEYFEYHTKPKNKNQILSIISKYDSDFKPNSKSEYSNSNYVLLSYILEKIYNKKYAEILDEQIIKTIHLKNTYYGSKINLNNNESSSYSFKGEWIKEPETHLSIPLGAGGIISTPQDLLKFAKALFNNKIISLSSVTKMSKLEDNYGMGLFKLPFNNKFSFGHYGGIDGFSSVFGYFIKEEYAFAIVSNGSDYNINKIKNVLLKGLFNMPFKIPTFKNYKLKSENLNKYLGIYSDSSFPLKINITKSNTVLMAQATGQSAFSLNAFEKDKFEFKKAGIILEFDTKNNQMLLKQGGRNFILTKE